MDLQKLSTGQKGRTLVTHLANEKTKAQRGDVICSRSHHAKGGLKTGHLPPGSPLPLPPALSQSRPQKSTLTPSCCKAASNPTTLEMGGKGEMKREGKSCSQTAVSAEQSPSNREGASGIGSNLPRRQGDGPQAFGRPWC